ncbi:MAG: alpha-xylosidase [Candidatus Faecivicinus sp.]|nr:alpha-xylosidase [Candidatus Faecivicinus sp.]
MNFNDGSWLVKPGYSMHKPEYVMEYHIYKDRLHLLALCHGLNKGDDYTAGPAVEYELFAPRRDMIGVRAIHYRGSLKDGPAYPLNCEDRGFHVEELEDKLIVHSGRMTAVVPRRRAMSISFYYDGRLLTASQPGSMAYVADAEYEADARNSFGHFKPVRPYMEETYMRERLTLDVDEYIYGLGERFVPLVRNGQRVKIWNTDCGSDSDQSYKSIPFYLSSRGYGVLVNMHDHVDYEVGAESVRHVQFSVEGESIEYIVMAADEPKEVLTLYTALTGRSPVPPAWSFGLWMSTSWITDFNCDEILDVIDRMAAMDIPLSVFHFDARWMADFHDCDFVWHERYGDAREMLRKIHERGVKVCCWINPYVSQPSRLFEEGLKNGYFLKRKNGKVYQNDLWMAGMAIVDFTNPAATEWYMSRLGEMVDMGVDTFKTDFAERIPVDVVYHDGSDPEKMHNYYTFLYNQAVFNMLKEKRGEKEAMIFGRSCTVGSQRFPVQWGGDNHSSYVSMAETLRGGLSFCQSGFGFWAHDISGFNDTATPDLYKRWTAFGMLSTHSRLHGSQTPRMPWYFDDESGKVLSHFAKLKCSLMPYIYANTVRVHLEGQPEMRAMMLDFPKDRNCLYLDRQYMLGDSLLVAPIFNDRGDVDFYVPEGRWTDLLTGRVYSGGQWYSENCDYYHLPLLVKPNSIIPMGENSRTVYDYADGAEYAVYQLEDGRSTERRVYDANGEEATCMTICRRGNKLHVSMEGRDAAKPWKLRLKGIMSVQTTAKVEICEDGAVIMPAAGTTELEIHL